MLKQPHISTHYLYWLHDYIKNQGISPTAFGALPRYEEHPFIAMAVWRLRLDQAAHYLNDPELGIHFGVTISPYRFGMLGYLLHHSENFGQVLMRAWQFRMLFFRLHAVTPEWTDNDLTISWRFDHTMPHYQEETFAIVATVQFARLITGSPLIPLAVGLVSAKPSDSVALADFLQCPIHYQQQQTWIRADRSIYQLPTTQPDSQLGSLLEKQVMTLLASLPEDDPLISTIRSQIITLLPEGKATQELVAERLNISTRSLHRQLAERHYKFRDLLAETRYQLAQIYLIDVRYGLAEIALLLGYGQQSTFNHAFKDWTGTTPSAWRKDQMLR